MNLNFSSAQTRQSFSPAGWNFARLAVGVITSLSMLLFSTFATAGNTYGVVEIVAGKVSVIDVAGKPRAIRVKDKILEGETIVAESDGQLHVRTEDYGYAVFRANSKIVVQSYLAEGGKDDNVVISIVYGALRSVSGWIGKHNPEKYSIRTSSATIGIRGTDHETLHIPLPGPGEKTVDEPGTYERVYSGRTSLKNAAGETIVEAGHIAFASHDAKKAPVPVERIPAAYKQTSTDSRIETRKGELAKELEERRAEKHKAASVREEAEKKSPQHRKSHHTETPK